MNSVYASCCCILPVPTTTNQHEQNCAALIRYYSLASEKLFVFLQGDVHDVTIPVITEYYSLLATCNLMLSAVIILPGCSDDHIAFVIDTQCDAFLYTTATSNNDNDQEVSKFSQIIRSLNAERQVRQQSQIHIEVLPSSADDAVKFDSHLPEGYFDQPRGNLADKFRYGALGGTFDRLHSGHKVMLTQAALICSERLIVAVSDGSLLKNKKHKEFIESFETRAEKTCEFMRFIKPSLKIECVRLLDPFGPAITVQELECLIVSQETVKGGDMINEERKQRGMAPLYIAVIDFVQPKSITSADTKLSSTYLRELAAAAAASSSPSSSN